MATSIPAPIPPAAEQKAVVVAKAAINAARILGLTNAQLGRVVGLSESQVSRVSHGKAALEGKPYELALLVVRLYRGLAGIVGNDDEAAESWMRAANHALGRAPIEHIQTAAGLFETVAYVDSFRARI